MKSRPVLFFYTFVTASIRLKSTCLTQRKSPRDIHHGQFHARGSAILQTFFHVFVSGLLYKPRTQIHLSFQAFATVVAFELMDIAHEHERPYYVEAFSQGLAKAFLGIFTSYYDLDPDEVAHLVTSGRDTGGKC